MVSDTFFVHYVVLNTLKLVTFKVMAVLSVRIYSCRPDTRLGIITHALCDKALRPLHYPKQNM